MTMKRIISLFFLVATINVTAQKFTHYTTTEGNEWQQSKTSLSSKAAANPVLTITGNEQGQVFKAWGTCFNELDLDALELLKSEEAAKGDADQYTAEDH